MTLWTLIIVASLAVLALKIAGYLVPTGLLERPTPARVAGLLTVALLSGLTVTQTVGEGAGLVVDARLPAIVLSGVLLAVRTPFIVVVIAAAVVAALLRLAGWAS